MYLQFVAISFLKYCFLRVEFKGDEEKEERRGRWSNKQRDVIYLKNRKYFYIFYENTNFFKELFSYPRIFSRGVVRLFIFFIFFLLNRFDFFYEFMTYKVVCTYEFEKCKFYLILKFI